MMHKQQLRFLKLDQENKLKVHHLDFYIAMLLCRNHPP